MKQVEEMKKDLIDIFDEEYYKRNLITPQNTAKKLVKKGYRKQSEVAREIFEEIDLILFEYNIILNGEIGLLARFTELKKKYTEVEK